MGKTVNKEVNKERDIVSGHERDIKESDGISDGE